MILLIDGATHTGKTNLSQYLLENTKVPYLSIDHLKMGLLRSGKANYTVEDDNLIMEETWPIIVEMMKTMIENGQNYIIEGCYIPKNWKDSFSEEYSDQIRYVCLVFSDSYINNHYDAIISNENVIEKRVYSENIKDLLLSENKLNLELCKVHNLFYIMIDEDYNIEKIGEKLREKLDLWYSIQEVFI